MGWNLLKKKEKNKIILFTLEIWDSEEIKWKSWGKKRFLGWVETRQIAKWEKLNWMKERLRGIDEMRFEKLAKCEG